MIKFEQEACHCEIPRQKGKKNFMILVLAMISWTIGNFNIILCNIKGATFSQVSCLAPTNLHSG